MMESRMSRADDIIRKRTSPGILILGPQNKLLFSNEAGFSLLSELQKGEISLSEKKSSIPEEILDLCRHIRSVMNMENRESLCHTVLEHSSGISYSLRAFPLRVSPREEFQGNVTVLIEKIVERHDIDFRAAKENFNLTNRELELLKILSKGNSNRQVADKLHISELTVKDHIKNIMRKMDVSTRGEIMAALMDKLILYAAFALKGAMLASVVKRFISMARS
jgi:DNA-binding CsgD family transcriptional regulator